MSCLRLFVAGMRRTGTHFLEIPGHVTFYNARPLEAEQVAKITGIGGVFFKAKENDRTLAEWYKRHLGLELKDFGGAVLRWPEDGGEDKGVTAWHVAGPKSKWFSPSESSFMINYRVDNMEEMLTQLRAGGIAIHQGPESHENGKFAWILDPDGNKVELWEPKMWEQKNKEA